MHHPLHAALTRRRMISSLVGGSLLMPSIIGALLHGGEPAAAPVIDPLSPKAPHFPAKAKRVIFLCMSGGASHVDTFDYKPKLIADAGKKAPNGKFLKRELRESLKVAEAA